MVSDAPTDPLRAVIVDFPVAIATTRPSESTFTIFGALLASVIGTFDIRVPLASKPRAVARAESPTLSVVLVTWSDTRAAVGMAAAVAADAATGVESVFVAVSTRFVVSADATALSGFTTAAGAGAGAARSRVA